MKQIKIFSRAHILLDEIEDYSDLKYTWTLNGKGAAEFKMPLESNFCTEENFAFRNHIEIWYGSNCIWGGQIVTLQFNDSKLQVGCYGYLSLLDKRRLRAKSYNEMAYGDLFTQLLADVNAIAATGITIGSVESGSLKTQRSVKNEDILLTKLHEYCEDANYDIEIGSDRKLNFYLRKGSDKSEYILEYGGDADNIIKAPTLARNALSLANSIFCQVDNGGIITSTKEDAASITFYGYQEVVLTGNDSVINQNTLDNKTAAELQRTSYPLNCISLRAIDSSLCPFSDIAVGDTVTISLLPYWNYKEALRILEMTHDENTGEREIVLGQSVYRQQPPKVKIYGK